MFLMPTYSAREDYDEHGSADFLMEEIKKTSPSFAIEGVFDKKSLLKSLRKTNFGECVLLFLGAGDVDQLPKKLLKHKKKKT